MFEYQTYGSATDFKDLLSTIQIINDAAWQTHIFDLKGSNNKYDCNIRTDVHKGEVLH